MAGSGALSDTLIFLLVTVNSRNRPPDANAMGMLAYCALQQEAWGPLPVYFQLLLLEQLIHCLGSSNGVCGVLH